LEDRPGSIKEVSDIMRSYGCLVVSILSGQDVQAGYRRVYIRVRDCDPERLEELKEELKAKANVLYVMDHAKRNKQT